MWCCGEGGPQGAAPALGDGSAPPQLYVQARLVGKWARLLRPTIQFFLIAFAIYVGYTRVSDYKHHWSDVLAGLLQGALIAVLIVSIPLPSAHGGGVPALGRAALAGPHEAGARARGCGGSWAAATLQGCGSSPQAPALSGSSRSATSPTSSSTGRPCHATGRTRSAGPACH